MGSAARQRYGGWGQVGRGRFQRDAAGRRLALENCQPAPLVGLVHVAPRVLRVAQVAVADADDRRRAGDLEGNGLRGVRHAHAVGIDDPILDVTNVLPVGR